MHTTLERDRLRLTQSEGVTHAIKQRLDHDRAPKIDATSSDLGLGVWPLFTGCGFMAAVDTALSGA